MRFWIGWISAAENQKGCPKPPFIAWVTGFVPKEYTDPGPSEITYCAWVEAEKEEDIVPALTRYYPDAPKHSRFIRPVSDEWDPGDRFPGAVCQPISG